MNSMQRREWHEENDRRRKAGLSEIPREEAMRYYSSDTEGNIRQQWEQMKGLLESSRKCDVCVGQPLESGRKCICGGEGTSAAEKAGLRTTIQRQADQIESLYESLRQASIETDCDRETLKEQENTLRWLFNSKHAEGLLVDVWEGRKMEEEGLRFATNLANGRPRDFDIGDEVIPR